MDFLPTAARLAQGEVPDDRIIDGKDIWPLMSGAADAVSPHEAFFYYHKAQLQCVRSGKWKLHLPLEFRSQGCWDDPEPGSPLRLYDLENNIHEDDDVSDAHPEVVDRLLALAQQMREDIGDADVKGKNQRPAGRVNDPKPQLLKGQ